MKRYLDIDISTMMFDLKGSEESKSALTNDTSLRSEKMFENLEITLSDSS